jgi:hypothetical protein
MRNMLIAALAVAAIPLTAQAATVYVVHGNGAIASFTQISEDGCVVISGQVAVFETVAGEDKEDGVYAVATYHDYCLDIGDLYGGYAPLSFTSDGLAGATAEGSLVLSSFNYPAELTLDLDLAWTGTGAVSSEGGRMHDEYVTNFSWQKSRAATIAGTIDCDGEPASIDGGLVIAGTSGEIYH